MVQQRLTGRYNLRSAPIRQLDAQIDPIHFVPFEGYKLPIRGPFTQVIAERGTAILYVSQPGEVPLYYSTTPGWIHWSEQELALPPKVNRINQGEAVVWTPRSCVVRKVEEIGYPDIVPAVSKDLAIAQYKTQLMNAVERRLGTARKVAVSQSGGIDSLMVTWALLQLGIEVVPITVCTGIEDPDIAIANAILPQMGAPLPIPVIIEKREIESLIKEALLCFEKPDVGNIKMAVGNILMARKCKELGIDLIFNGHAQDDLHGVGGLALGGYNKAKTGTESERWRNARRKEVHDATGMVKMFASTFRRYGVGVRMPYYDADLIEWTLSQPTDIIPVHHAKPFARAVACSILPPGPWQHQKYNSTGYITGAGYYEDRLRDFTESKMLQLRTWLRDYKAYGWQEIAKIHAAPFKKSKSIAQDSHAQDSH